MQPDYIFETSWEVCNRVGGIYAVLSTRAASMQQEHTDKVIFFGPELGETSDIYFAEDSTVLPDWRPQGVRVGRWKVPGAPIAVLVQWEPLYKQKNSIYAAMWEQFGVQSHAAYGDYDTCSLFAYSVGQLAENLYTHLHCPTTVLHCNEWQTAFALLYIKAHCPSIGTLFTTHATTVGRSIAGNGKPLYDYLQGYHGDPMAQELNVLSKHSAEKTAARIADCFTTVSDLTARECAQLLDKPVDIVTPNGFEQDFVPKGQAFVSARRAARKALMAYACARGAQVTENDCFVGISGRLEWKNKGIDVFLSAMERLGNVLPAEEDRKVVAFVMIPYLERQDYTVGKVRVVFLPSYLNGNDGVLNKSYYNLLIGLDITVFPSYYEPWGYTPLESIAFRVPTVTTTLSGFGLWCMANGIQTLRHGVEVIPRTDGNQEQVVQHIVSVLMQFLAQDSKSVSAMRQAASAVSKKADWRHFFPLYRKAYAIALRKVAH